MVYILVLVAGVVTGMAFDLFSLCAVSTLTVTASLAACANLGVASDLVISSSVTVLLQVGYMMGLAARNLPLSTVRSRRTAQKLD